MSTSTETITTTSWRLDVPGAGNGRTICVPTVHSAGDQRVIRCAQAALAAGYRIHFLWLGPDAGKHHRHPRIAETCLRPARSTLQRLTTVPVLAWMAWRTGAELWHVHDFYLLPIAWIWSLWTGRPFVYDVHEYYPEYYSYRIGGLKFMRRCVRRMILAAERLMATRGGVNAVSDQLAERFSAAGIRAVATPNYPASTACRQAARPLVPDLLRKVVYTGNLSDDYGAEVILEIAHLLTRTAPEIEMTVLLRFPSEVHRTRFTAWLAKHGTPRNLRLLEPVVAHRVPHLVADHGIGLSALQESGQNHLAVATKLYEYATVGLAIVASDLPGTRTFVTTSATGALVPADRADRYVEAILHLIENATEVCRTVNARAVGNIAELSWERACAPRLQQLLRDLVAE